ncbi:alpha/beta fold hydrolase [Mameliella sediminis]|uniref:alpha/beta fold hydrolase n=1 Tax=Mameliella sediminis TaxID=2836866 RepID=UPI001C46909C|nr:alpha/beta fold hydrolase [Mameliella sediminis]MBY6115337.1 alpha/beta hydrolase [Antarctobacter heliothermus]MBY6144598.1 alpha/beta hydrolase [Mameliella alba]MBV7395712.1 alpha/beta hydrolase [Mameliella sediminis]MBY6160125.1 alpha/beta hydrolase [Mameliella alba]MBY6168595.1 alpha/beta hydrolase [Mameliella alba]
MCDGRLFSPQAAGLPGDIRTAGLTSADSVQALAAHVLAEAPGRFALGGLSMGGIVAMEIVRQAPDRVTRLALMDTNPLAERDEVKARRGPQMDKARQGRLAEVIRDEMKPNYLADGPRRAEILDLCMEMALELGPEVFCRQSVALRDRPDQTETLRAYRGPTLILCGADDKPCPVSRHELMHGLMPHATLTIIARAGHLPTLERPEETNAALARWLTLEPAG